MINIADGSPRKGLPGVSFIDARPSQANKGVACSENKARKRTKCVHTLLGALALWRAGGKGNEGLDVGEDIQGEEGGNDGGRGADTGGASCQRTAQILLDDDGKK